MAFDDAELLTEQTARDPYPAFARMRAEDPVYWHAPTSTWYVTSYPLARALLTERTLSARPGDYLGVQHEADLPVVKRMEAFFNSWMLFSDPPHHTVLRQAAAADFTRRTSESWRAYVRQYAQQRLSRPDDVSDLMTDFAKPVAARLTCGVLGVPDGDEDMLQKWSVDLLGYLFTPTADAGRARAAAAAIDELERYLQEVVLPRLRADRGDGIQPMRGLLALPTDAALALFTQLLTGGIDPVASCLGTALRELLDPAASTLRAAVSKSGDVASVVEEALRYDAPFHFVPRSTTSDLRVGNHVLPAGQRVLLVIAMANRDPSVFPEPDAFRLRRDDAGHLSFGLGRHYCLGAMLSRVVVEESIRAVLEVVRASGDATLVAERAPTFGATTWQRLALQL